MLKQQIQLGAPPGDYVSVPRAGELLGYSPNTVRKLLMAKLLKWHRGGPTGHVRIEVASIMEFKRDRDAGQRSELPQVEQVI